MHAPNETLSWVQRAEEDYELAQICVAHQPILCYGAAFHAYQCAEKYLKAILVHRSQIPPRTHDLAALATLCVESGVSVSMPLDELLLLNQYAVQVRYPGEDPTPAEARKALETVAVLRTGAREILGLQ